MKIKVESNFSEVRAKTFFRFHLLKKSSSKYFYYGFSLLFLILGLVFTFYYIKTPYAIACYISAVVLIFIRPIQINSIVKRIIKDNRPTGEKYTTIFEDDIVTYVLGDTIKKYKYSDFYEVCETSECLYLYVNKVAAIVVPKYAIKHDDRTLLLNFIKEHVKYHKYRFKQTGEE